MNTKQLLCVLSFAGMCVSNLEAAPELSGVTVRQRWPWSRLVDIDFVVANATEPFDINVQAWNGNNAMSLPMESLAGTYGVTTNDGVHHIVFDPTQTSYTNAEVLSKFHVTLTATNAPLYMIVDLTKSAGADGQIEYIYPGDPRLETYGRFTNVWFGVTNDSVYATDKLVLRRVHAGSFKMGDSVPPTISTTLTKEFYAGVFEVTQRQWELITGAKPSYFNNSTYCATRPVETVTYDDIRGATNGAPAVNWPVTDLTLVSTNSFLGKLRTKTGLTDFDLPTEAQWEYLCRAGTTTYYNDNGATPVNTTSNAQMDTLGRYQYNGGKVWSGSAWNNPAPGCGATNGTAVVGSYQANAWGLYDTHGNVWEWCLDWWDTASLAGGSDPSGALAGSYRVIRGGTWSKTASSCRSANRECVGPSYLHYSIGFRLVRTLP